jgi:hypothetical protein
VHEGLRSPAGRVGNGLTRESVPMMGRWKSHLVRPAAGSGGTHTIVPPKASSAERVLCRPIEAHAVPACSCHQVASRQARTYSDSRMRRIPIIPVHEDEAGHRAARRRLIKARLLREKEQRPSPQQGCCLASASDTGLVGFGADRSDPASLPTLSL